MALSVLCTYSRSNLVKCKNAKDENTTADSPRWTVLKFDGTSWIHRLPMSSKKGSLLRVGATGSKTKNEEYVRNVCNEGCFFHALILVAFGSFGSFSERGCSW
ncbi:hypothetical protein M413DRAFT_258305 [Hebeloma cylindrosporum]|uniref:Uncharacterized protein n=1 Tax=Hebeloma cylindrosporum TaxID=76867 RepID=A0A0C2XIJ0_HEBCY|nr:hypothetical protein M413DRAFT_258305 [Hebeloma cylindrosporum h7]